MSNVMHNNLIYSMNATNLGLDWILKKISREIISLMLYFKNAPKSIFIHSSNVFSLRGHVIFADVFDCHYIASWNQPSALFCCILKGKKLCENVSSSIDIQHHIFTIFSCCHFHLDECERNDLNILFALLWNSVDKFEI